MTTARPRVAGWVSNPARTAIPPSGSAMDKNLRIESMRAGRCADGCARHVPHF